MIRRAPLLLSDEYDLATGSTMFGDGRVSCALGHQDMATAAGPLPHLQAQYVVGIDHDGAVGTLQHLGLESGHLLKRFDAIDADMVILYVEQCSHVIAVTRMSEA